MSGIRSRLLKGVKPGLKRSCKHGALQGNYNGTNIRVIDHYDDYLRQWVSKLQVVPSIKYVNDLNWLLKRLRSTNFLYACDRFVIFATEQQQHARVSIINSGTANITEVNSPTWTRLQGYTGNGTTSYLDTNYAPSVSAVRMTQNNAAFGIYSRTNSTSTSNDAGATDGTKIQNTDLVRGKISKHGNIKFDNPN